MQAYIAGAINRVCVCVCWQAYSRLCCTLRRVIYSFTPWSPLNLGTTYHDVVEQNRIEEKRRDERCVCCTQNEAKFWVYYRSFGCRGLLKEEEKRRILRTWPPHSSPNLRSSGGHSPRPGILSAHVRCTWVIAGAERSLAQNDFDRILVDGGHFAFDSQQWHGHGLQPGGGSGGLGTFAFMPFKAECVLYAECMGTHCCASLTKPTTHCAATSTVTRWAATAGVHSRRYVYPTQGLLF